ncbi:MAG: haloacid dehalogenase type II [Candidatus Eremiobacteraeota bacterium]|nr:haloacid dehalogenase type II [Candidatus Eremiobacteraeota bacterium]
MAESIRVVAFDLYGTLIDVDALVDALRQYTPMPEAACAAWRQRQLQLSNAASSGRYMDFDRITFTALHEIAPRFHMKLDPSSTKALIDAWAALPPYDDVVPALKSAAKSMVPMVVLTNAVAHTARNALAHASIGDFFSHLFSADAVKTFKPRSAVYEQILTLGVAPSEVLFVSSNDWDAMGARQAGFHTVWCNRRRAVLSPKPERTIDDLYALERVLSEYALTAF